MSAESYLPISEIKDWSILPDSYGDVDKAVGVKVDAAVIRQIFRHNQPKSVAQFGCSSARQAVEFIKISRELDLEIKVTCIDPRLRAIVAPISYQIVAPPGLSWDYFRDFVRVVYLTGNESRIVPVGGEIVATQDIMWMSIKLRNDGCRYDLIFIDASEISCKLLDLIMSAYGMLNIGGVLILSINNLTKDHRNEALSVLQDFANEHFLGISLVDDFAFTWKDGNFPLQIDSKYLLSWQETSGFPTLNSKDKFPEVCLAAITKNEAKIVAGMIKSAAPFITSAVFVDNQSDDSTVDDIQNLCIELKIPYKIKLSNKERFDDLRNDALSLVPPSAAWVLMLDADERLSLHDMNMFQNLINTEVDMWTLPRIHLKGVSDKIEMIERSYPDHSARLFRANKGLYWVNPVHEAIVGYQSHHLAPCYNSPDEHGGPHIFHLKGVIRTEAEFNIHVERYRKLEAIARPLGYAEANKAFESNRPNSPNVDDFKPETVGHQYLENELEKPIYEVGKTPEEIKEAQTAAKLKQVQNLSLLGQAAMRAGDIEAAKSAYLSASVLVPQDPAFQREIAHCLAQQQQFDDAIRFMKRAVELAPDNAENNAILGHLFASNGQFTMADAPLRRAIALAPSEIRYQEMFDRLALESKC